MKVIYLFVLLPVIEACIHNFASKTNYNDSLELDIKDNFFPPLQPDTCPFSSYVVSLYRHGTRYPSEKHVKRVKNIFKRLVPISEEGRMRLTNLNKTLQELSEKEEKMLAARGFLELEEIGGKLKHEHPNLFEGYRDEDFKYFVTSKNRTVDSFRGFYKGIRGNNTTPTPIEDDKLLRYHKYCKKYIEEVADNDTALYEYDNFMRKQQEHLNDKMYNNYKLFFERTNISTAELDSLYDVMGLEVAVLQKHFWSSTFLDKNTTNILEYASDLKRYWKYGRGYKINSEMSCPLLKHIFDGLDKVIDGSSSLKGTFYFAHAETNIPLYTLLGLFPGELTSDSFVDSSNRTFKTTHIIPLAGNIRFAISNCTGVPHISVSMKDSLLKWPSCGKHSCPYAEVREYYAAHIDDCDYDKVCANGSKRGGGVR